MVRALVIAPLVGKRGVSAGRVCKVLWSPPVFWGAVELVAKGEATAFVIGGGDHYGGGVVVTVDPFGDFFHDIVVLEDIVEMAGGVVGVACMVLDRE